MSIAYTCKYIYIYIFPVSPANRTSTFIGYIDSESSVSLEQDLAARRYSALVPDDDYDSEDY